MGKIKTSYEWHKRDIKTAEMFENWTFSLVSEINRHKEAFSFLSAHTILFQNNNIQWKYIEDYNAIQSLLSFTGLRVTSLLHRWLRFGFEAHFIIDITSIVLTYTLNKSLLDPLKVN